jgi:DNA-binding transcriptional ArsR family regulator
MARSPTTADAFNAIAEPARREILVYLAGGERSVNEVAERLSVKQPQASKHLKVLKTVGLVTVRDDGTKRLYRLKPAGLKPIHDWVSAFERFWAESLDRLADHLDELQRKEQTDGNAE